MLRQFTFYVRSLAILTGALSIAGIGIAAFAIDPTEPFETIFRGYHQIISMAAAPFEWVARLVAGLFGTEFAPGQYWPNVLVASLLVLGGLVAAQNTDQSPPEGKVAARFSIGLAALLMFSVMVSAAYLTGVTVQIATMFSGNWMPLIPGLDATATAYLALPAYCGAIILGTTRSIREIVIRGHGQRGAVNPERSASFSAVERRAVWKYLISIHAAALLLLLVMALLAYL